MLQHITKLFLVIVVLSCFACFDRADYNLPLFAFAFFMWDAAKGSTQKLRLYYLFLFSWFIDFIWLLYWGITWNNNGANSSSKKFVLTVSIIEFVVKFMVLIALLVWEPTCSGALKNIWANTKSIFSRSSTVANIEDQANEYRAH